MLKKFFAVTISGSLYEINDDIRCNYFPTIKKIAGNPSQTVKIGSFINNGKLVGISDIGICLFDPTPRVGRDFEMLNISYWGGKTSAIVGLFLDKDSAKECLVSGNYTEFDEKYRDKTLATLQGIGQEHPIFIIGKSVIRIFSL